MKTGKGDIIANQRGTWFRVVEVGKELALENCVSHRLVRQDRARVEATWTMVIQSINSGLREARARVRAEVKATPAEVKQAFLDLMYDQGKTLGQACEATGLSLSVALSVYRASIKIHRVATIEKKVI